MTYLDSLKHVIVKTSKFLFTVKGLVRWIIQNHMNYNFLNIESFKYFRRNTELRRLHWENAKWLGRIEFPEQSGTGGPIGKNSRIQIDL